MDRTLLIPLLTSAVVLWAVYRRLRRTFGRQPVQPRRLFARAGLLIVVGCLLLATAVKEPIFGAAIIGGAALGVVLEARQ